MSFEILWETLQQRIRSCFEALRKALQQRIQSFRSPRVDASPGSSTTSQDGQDEEPNATRVVLRQPADINESLGHGRHSKNAVVAKRRRDLITEYQKRMSEKYGSQKILDIFGQDTIPDRAIYVEAREHKSEFYRWRSGQLAELSKTNQNIVAFLASERLPRKPPPGTNT